VLWLDVNSISPFSWKVFTVLQNTGPLLWTFIPYSRSFCMKRSWRDKHLASILEAQFSALWIGGVLYHPVQGTVNNKWVVASSSTPGMHCYLYSWHSLRIDNTVCCSSHSPLQLFLHASYLILYRCLYFQLKYEYPSVQ